MASLYTRNRSPFWWIKFRDPRTGKTLQQSTGFRVGVGPDTRRAQQLRAERTLQESKLSASSPKERWEKWVPDFIRLRYADAPASSLRHRIAWRNLGMFLTEKEITLPRQLTRQHCADYMAWRQKPNVSKGKYRAGHNTAHLELKVLGIIMGEAVLRQFAPFNPCRDMAIKRIRGAVKPALTDKAVEMIRNGFAKEKEPLQTFLRNSFEIAYYHGVRLSETHVNLTHIDGRRITFLTKGGKVHTVMLHPALYALFDGLKADKKTETYAKPKSPAKEWHNYLNRIGARKFLPGACFHSTRVTVASKLATSGVSEKKAMAYMGHASTTVHRSYVRLRAEDLTDCSDAIS